MLIAFDPAKSAKNEQERGLPFAVAAYLFDCPRLEWEDRRKDYGEIRSSTLGEIEGRFFFASFTRREETIRIISFRKANARAVREYRAYIQERGKEGQD